MAQPTYAIRVGAVLFRMLIGSITHFSFTSLPEIFHVPWWLLLVAISAVGGLLKCNGAFLEIRLRAQSILCKNRIRDFAERLPSKCIIVSIYRNGDLVIPHGDTTLDGGDLLTIFVKHSHIPMLIEVFGEK